jgi:hypothetical protein
MDNIAWTDEPEAAKVLVQNILDLTRILSPTGYEKEISNFCAFELMKCGFVVQTDPYGNIMAQRGWTADQDKYVLLNAHMDVVDINEPKYAVTPKQVYQDQMRELYRQKFMLKCKCAERGDVVPDKYGDMAFTSKESERKYDAEVGALREKIRDLNNFVNDNRKNPDVCERVIENPWHPECIQYNPVSKVVDCPDWRKAGVYLGGDDKAGVAIILTLAQLSNEPFKVLLTVAEEMPINVELPDGKHDRVLGIELIPDEFFNDVAFDITLDRREKNDLVVKIRGDQLSPRSLFEFVTAIGALRQLTFHWTDGLRCDALRISGFVPAMNMSVGYYDPHHVGDYIKVVETHNVMTVVKDVIEEYNSGHRDYQFPWAKKYVGVESLDQRPPVQKKKEEGNKLEETFKKAIDEFRGEGKGKPHGETHQFEALRGATPQDMFDNLILDGKTPAEAKRIVEHFILEESTKAVSEPPKKKRGRKSSKPKSKHPHRYIMIVYQEMYETLLDEGYADIDAQTMVDDQILEDEETEDRL